MAITAGRFSATDVASLGSAGEAVAGVAVVALSIIGLGGVAAGDMVAIATIIFGVAMVVQGLELAAETSIGQTGAGGGIMVEFLAGLAGIILGILAFVGHMGGAVAPAAVIAFGGALLLGGMARASSLSFGGEAWLGGAGAQIAIGFAAVVLGILAYVVPANQTMLTLVALVSLGSSLIITGAAVSLPQAVGVTRERLTTAETTRGTYPGEGTFPGE
jgi:hypothetical protein